MKFNFLESSSIVKKFLIFNLLTFSILGIFTLFYLDAIKPNLIKERSNHHLKIINNTINHIERLNIVFEKKDLTKFFLSTRFLFQNLDRVQLFDINSNLLADTDTLDLDQGAFSPISSIKEVEIDEKNQNEINLNSKKKEKIKASNAYDYIKKFLNEKKQNLQLTFDEIINNNLYVITVKNVFINEKEQGYIIIYQVSNDILIAVKERKNFIIRTVFAVALVIFIFSIFLDHYILKPIRKLVLYTKAIKAKNDKISKLSELLKRKDEIGQFSRSLDEMTNDLYHRINIAEKFSTDLAHEIRNPLASIRGASEILDSSSNLTQGKKEKLLKIISHDITRIERLITDYSQMLKDEASLSRSKMEKINIIKVIDSVVEDFNMDLENSDKKILIKVEKHSLNGIEPEVLGVENRLQQILANLLDNAISFSPENGKIVVSCKIDNFKVQMSVVDEGPGFDEKNINRVFTRFYSNRPEKFGEHSGLGLNIVKNITELHGGSINASNLTLNGKGAKVDIVLPLYKDNQLV